MRMGISNRWLVIVICTAVSLGILSQAGADPCVLPDESGTVILPDADCGYLGPDEFHMVVDGLPAGTTIVITGIHKDFFCRVDSTSAACVAQREKTWALA